MILNIQKADQFYEGAQQHRDTQKVQLVIMHGAIFLVGMGVSYLLLKALLQDTCTVIEAADGPAGVEQAGAYTPDFILMDLSLPVMDGFQALDAIRNQDALRHIPVLALTASAMKGNREEILAYGFDGYISKPIDVKLLEEKIREKLYGDAEPDDTGD